MMNIHDRQRKLLTELSVHKDIVVKHKAGRHQFHSIFTRNLSSLRTTQNAIKMIFGDIPKLVIFNDDDGTWFEGNRLENDLCGLDVIRYEGGMFFHIATFCTDRPKYKQEKDEYDIWFIQKTQTYSLPVIERYGRRNGDGELYIDLEDDEYVGFAIVNRLITGLTEDCGFAKIKEEEIIPVDETGNIVVESNIVQNATGHFITHGTCRVCKESLACRFFETLEEAREFLNDAGEYALCGPCYHKECEESGLCEFCINVGDKCDYDRSESDDPDKECPNFVYNDEHGADYDGPNNACSCPVRGSSE